MATPYERLGQQRSEAERRQAWELGMLRIKTRIDNIVASLHAERRERKRNPVPLPTDGRNPCAFCNHDANDHRNSTLSTGCLEDACSCARFVGMPR